MAEVPRELFLPESMRADAYRDGAVGIEEGQTMSQPWIVACMTSLLELRGGETVLEVGAGLRLRRGGAVALSPAAWSRSSATRRWRTAPAPRWRSWATTTSRCAWATARPGRPDAAPFGGITVTATAEEAPPPALFGQLAPGAALVCPVRRDGREMLYRFRDGAVEPVVPVRFVPLVGRLGGARVLGRRRMRAPLVSSC